MYNLTVGLGSSIIGSIMNPFDDANLYPKIKQHRVILSSSLIEYYLSTVPERYRDQLELYFDSIAYNEETSMSFKDIPELDARQNLISFVDKVPMKVLVSQKEEFDSYKLGKVKITTPESIRNNENNAFNRYTFPIVNHVAKASEKCDFYAAWFGHLFENEKNITIIDRYLLAANGRESFEKYYLPRISSGSRIDIYCSFEDSDFSSENEIKDLIKKEYANWNVHVFLCADREFHDRFIILNDIQISLGVGLSFLHPSGSIIKNCTINISKDRKIQTPKAMKVL